jgi:hypothetical protein
LAAANFTARNSVWTELIRARRSAPRRTRHRHELGPGQRGTAGAAEALPARVANVNHDGTPLAGTPAPDISSGFKGIPVLRHRLETDRRQALTRAAPLTSRSHSARIADTGSMRAAFRAGSQAAASDVAASTSTASAKVGTSCGEV